MAKNFKGCGCWHHTSGIEYYCDEHLAIKNGITKEIPLAKELCLVELIAHYKKQQDPRSQMTADYLEEFYLENQVRLENAKRRASVLQQYKTITK